MRVDVFRSLVNARALDPRTGELRDVVVAGPGGLYDVVDVRTHAGDLVLEVCKRPDPEPVTRRSKRRKAAA